LTDVGAVGFLPGVPGELGSWAWQVNAGHSRGQTDHRHVVTAVWVVSAPSSRSADRPNTIEQLITRIVDRIVTNIAASQAPIVHTVEQLAASPEELTREIIKLETISQYSPSKDLESQPRPVHVRTLKPGTRAVR
jgi:hypothetical protein